MANRNFFIPPDDEIDRDLIWQTLSVDLPAWTESPHKLIEAAATSLEEDSG